MFVTRERERSERRRSAKEEREREIGRETGGGGGATARGSSRRKGCGGERGVLRPTPRSMLSSEVPVGGGCAEFPAAEKRTPVFLSPRATTPSLLLLLLLFLLLSLFPACSGTEIPSPRRLYETTAVFLFDDIRFASGLIRPRERKYDGRSIGSNETTTS